MKHLIKITILLFVLAFSFNSCKKDEDEDQQEYNLDNEYFKVTDANYIEANFPESTGGGSITTLNGNNYVIPGGGNPLSVEINENVSNILIGVENVGGFYRLSTASRGIDELFIFYLLMNQDLIATQFNITIALEYANGLISNPSIIEVSLVQVGTGKLQISCSWNQLTDVDLHLVEPNGTEIYFGNSFSTNGGTLDLDSNAACDIDGINNENITYDENAIIETGEYVVRVDYWSDCEITELTNFNVVAYFEGELVSSTTGQNPYSGSFEQSEAEDGSFGREVMTFNLNVSKQQNIEIKNVFKFNYHNTGSKVKNLSPLKTH